MKSIALTFSLLFAFTALSAITPITTFQSGTYLGSGSYRTSNGASGTYASYITLQNSGWNIIQFRNGALYFYASVLNIDENGFFTIQITDNSNPAQPVTSLGQGNCGSDRCQFNVNLNNGVFVKTIVFDSLNRLVHSSGAIRYNDGSPWVQMEEDTILLPSAKKNTMQKF